MNCVKWSNCSLWTIWIKAEVSFFYFCIALFIFLAPYPGLSAGHYQAGDFADGSNEPYSLLLDEEFIRDAQVAIERHYNREYEASLEHLSEWQDRFPHHPIWPLLASLDAWWPVLVDLQNTSYDDTFLQVSEEVIDVCDQFLDDDPDHIDARIIRSIANGQLARYYSNRHSWYRSFRYGRRSLRDFFRVEETHPDIPDLNFGIGMYRYFAAYILDEYPLARPLGWMLPSGDREEGLARLKKAADNSIFMEAEATFFLGHIYLHFEQKADQALGYLEQLYQRYPDNTFYRRLYVRSLFQQGQLSRAESAITHTLAHWSEHESHEVNVMKEDLHTIRGRIHYHHNQLDAAERDFIEAVLTAETLLPFAERNNLITALYYLGEISIQKDNRAEARYYFNRAGTPDVDHPYRTRALEALKEYQL